MVGLVAEDAGDLQYAMSTAVPLDDDPSWAARFWAIWKANYPSNWPRLSILVLTMNDWARKVILPMGELEDDYNRQKMLHHASSSDPISILAEALERFGDSFGRLYEIWEDARPSDSTWATEYDRTWNKTYPRTFPSIAKMGYSLKWIDKAIEQYKDLGAQYGRRNKFIQAAEKEAIYGVDGKPGVGILGPEMDRARDAEFKFGRTQYKRGPEGWITLVNQNGIFWLNTDDVVNARKGRGVILTWFGGQKIAGWITQKLAKKYLAAAYPEITPRFASMAKRIAEKIDTP